MDVFIIGISGGVGDSSPGTCGHGETTSTDSSAANSSEPIWRRGARSLTSAISRG